MSSSYKQALASVGQSLKTVEIAKFLMVKEGKPSFSVHGVSAKQHYIKEGYSATFVCYDTILA